MLREIADRARMIRLLAVTIPMETNTHWWKARAWLISRDRDQLASSLLMLEGLKLRRN